MTQDAKHVIIFALGFGAMILLMTAGSLVILRHIATMASRVDTMNCFLHRQSDESC